MATMYHPEGDAADNTILKTEFVGVLLLFFISDAGAKAQNVYYHLTDTANKSCPHKGKLNVEVSWMMLVGWGGW